VYCLEGIDHPGVNLMDIRLDETSPLQADWREDILPGGLLVIQATGYVAESAGWQQRLYRRLNDEGVLRQSIPLMALPYYGWANRGANAMRVWVPRS
jgi:DUF1680 family protein